MKIPKTAGITANLVDKFVFHISITKVASEIFSKGNFMK